MGLGWSELLVILALLFFMLLGVVAVAALMAFLFHLSGKAAPAARPDDPKGHHRP